MMHDIGMDGCNQATHAIAGCKYYLSIPLSHSTPPANSASGTQRRYPSPGRHHAHVTPRPHQKLLAYAAIPSFASACANSRTRLSISPTSALQLPRTCTCLPVPRHNMGLFCHDCLCFFAHPLHRKCFDRRSSSLQSAQVCSIALVEVGVLEYSRLVRVGAERRYQGFNIGRCMQHLEKEELVPTRPVQRWHVRRVSRQ